MTREAAAHDIVIADAKKARYLVRGYLSASQTADGAEVDYVWDVFNKDKQRTQRVDDAIEVKGERRYVLSSIDHFTLGADGKFSRMIVYLRPPMA